MTKPFKISSSFCVLPWIHLSCHSDGRGRVCCDGNESLKDDQGKHILWNNIPSLKSYMNLKDYRTMRLQMLAGERPSHCKPCFQKEDHGVKSPRLNANNQYKPFINTDDLLAQTKKDGRLANPKILYLDIPMGNQCNLRCRMCSPWSSYSIAKDWRKMGKKFDMEFFIKQYKNHWYETPSFLHFIKTVLPSIQTLFLTGGEPLLLKGHNSLLKMIKDEGHASHINLRYNSNYTIIPKDIENIWKGFKRIDFNCSIDAYGKANNYIRYPSKWEKQMKNIRYLDHLASCNNHINIFIHTTLQAYNIARLPQFLDTLRYTNFKRIHRLPFLLWVKSPKWLTPSVLPKEFRKKIVSRIETRLDHYENFFLNYNKNHTKWSKARINMFREFCHMIVNENSVSSDFDLFIKETKNYDKLRNQSIVDYLPELATFFTKTSQKKKLLCIIKLFLKVN